MKSPQRRGVQFSSVNHPGVGSSRLGTSDRQVSPGAWLESVRLETPTVDHTSVLPVFDHWEAVGDDSQAQGPWSPASFQNGAGWDMRPSMVLSHWFSAGMSDESPFVLALADTACGGGCSGASSPTLVETITFEELGSLRGTGETTESLVNARKLTMINRLKRMAQSAAFAHAQGACYDKAGLYCNCGSEKGGKAFKGCDKPEVKEYEFHQYMKLDREGALPRRPPKAGKGLAERLASVGGREDKSLRPSSSVVPHGARDAIVLWGYFPTVCQFSGECGWQSSTSSDADGGGVPGGGSSGGGGARCAADPCSGRAMGYANGTMRVGASDAAPSPPQRSDLGADGLAGYVTRVMKLERSLEEKIKARESEYETMVSELYAEAYDEAFLNAVAASTSQCDAPSCVCEDPKVEFVGPAHWQVIYPFLDDVMDLLEQGKAPRPTGWVRPRDHWREGSDPWTGEREWHNGSIGLADNRVALVYCAVEIHVSGGTCRELRRG